MARPTFSFGQSVSICDQCTCLFVPKECQTERLSASTQFKFTSSTVMTTTKQTMNTNRMHSQTCRSQSVAIKLLASLRPATFLYIILAFLLLCVQCNSAARSFHSLQSMPFASPLLSSDSIGNSFICPSKCHCQPSFDKTQSLSVNCTSTGATGLPAFVPGTQLYSLRFEHNRLPVLVAKSFAISHLQHVQRVSLASNGLRSVQPDAFYGANQISDLDLSHNQLTLLPSHALTVLPQLQTLRINSNPLQELREQDVASIGESLIHFEIANCALQQLPELRLLRRLQSLNLTGNRLASLPEDLFCPLASLITLNLTNNALSDYRSLGVVDPATGSLCLPQLQHLDLSDNQLRELPETAVASLKELQSLNLHRNQISFVSELALRSLRNLRSLDLSDNQLVQLPNQTFRGCPELRALNLRNNSFESLSIELFKDLGHLSFLDLSNNRLTSDGLNNDTFVDLTRLLHLNLSSNRLRTLPVRLFQSQFKVHVLDLSNNMLERIEPLLFNWLYNLNVLRISGNQLRTIDVQTFSGLFVLAHLHLGDNQLTNIHELALYNSSSLESLHLQNNLLRSLPKALTSVRALKHLDVSGNAIVRFDNQSHTPLAQLSQLRTLYASRNQLSSLSIGSLRGLLNLKSLDLSHNRLQSLDYGVFHDAPSLVKLQLQQNSLADINGQFMKLSALLSLNVSHNRISWFDYALIPEQLHTLDLSSNEIRTLSNQSGKDRRLAVLLMANNLISQLTTQLLPSSLQHLDLSHNQLAQLPHNIFVQKHNLSFVDLSHNRFRSFEMSTFRLPQATNARSAPQFRLAGNPLLCDCHLEWLQRLARNQLTVPSSPALLALGASSTLTASSSTRNPHVQDLDQLQCETVFVKQNAIVPLLSVNSSSLLCRYRSHCFALCHCCEFDACDCEMQCPDQCTCYHDSSWQTNIADCSASNNGTSNQILTSVPTRVPMDVTDLYLDGQQLRTLASHTFIGRKNMRALYLNSSHVQHISNRTFNGLALLQSLHLQNNELTRLHGFEFDGLNSLRELHLEHNNLQFIADRTFEPLTSLQILRLHHNRLVQLPFLKMAAQMPDLQSMSLAGNQFHCECEILQSMQPLLVRVFDLQRVHCVLQNQRNANAVGPALFEFLASNCAALDSRLLQIAGDSNSVIREGVSSSASGSIPVHPNLIATGSSSASSSFLDQLPNVNSNPNGQPRLQDSSAFNEYLHTLRQSWPLLTALALFGMFLAVMLLSVYVYRKQLGIWAYAVFGIRLFQRASHSRYSMQSERLYDAFVSYAPQEEEFVRHKLAAELELGHPSYRLFLNYRDLPVTNYVKEAVAEVIQCSHRSILLLTPQYLSSENCLFELKMALHNSLHSDHQLILLQMDRNFNLHELYQFDDLHAALKSPNSTLIHYEDKRFWERLKYAMPVARSAQHYAYSMPSLVPYASTLPPQHTFGSPQTSLLTLPGQAQQLHPTHPQPPLPPPPPPPPSYCKKMSASSHTLRPSDLHRNSIVDFKRGLPMNV